MPEPEFGINATSIFVKIRKDVFTEEYLKHLGLNERQIKAVIYVKDKIKITNKKYQKLYEVSKRTATNDLNELVQKNVFEKVGTKRAIIG